MYLIEPYRSMFGFYPRKTVPGLPFMISLRSVSNQLKGVVECRNTLPWDQPKLQFKGMKGTKTVIKDENIPVLARWVRIALTDSFVQLCKFKCKLQEPFSILSIFFGKITDNNDTKRIW